MKKSILTGILAVVAGASVLVAQGAAPAAGPKQPAPKSQAELTAIQAMYTAQQQNNLDGVIKAADELVTKFADTEFKEIAFLLQAQAYKAKNDVPKAQVFAERVLEINPKNFQAELMAGEILVQATRENDLDREEKLGKADKYFNDTIAAVKAATKPNPQLADEQWAEAQKQVQAEAHDGLGRAALTRKKYDNATTEFKAAAELDPKEYTYQVRLASAYQLSGKNDEAGAVCDKLLAVPDLHPKIKEAAQSIKAATAKK